MKQPETLSDLRSRLEKLREKMRANGLDALLVADQENRAYLTHWYADSESGFVLITGKEALIITDSRYFEHAKSAIGFEVLETIQKNPGPLLARLSKKLKLKKLAFESNHLSVSDFKKIKKYLTGIQLVPREDFVESLRTVKDKTEIIKLREAARITTQTFLKLLKSVEAGVTEKQIAWELTQSMRSLGAEKNSWDPLIVAAAENSSMAHHSPGDRKIKKGDQVLVDFGCVYQGYCSDMTRMFFLGTPNEKQVQVYQAVLEAQKLGINFVRSGRTGKTIDDKVRSYLEKESDYFYRHGLGHGVGLEVHEAPVLSFRTLQKLEEGNVVTIEPGIYEPGWGGVRIEDMVLVTNNKAEILTKAPKEIEKVII